MSRPKHTWRPLGQLCWNTRIGLNFTPETWGWVLAHLPLFHVLYLQEVKDVAKVRHILGEEWTVWPFNGGGAHTTACVVAVRDRRFDVLTQEREPIVSAKHEREIIGMVVRDKRTNRHMFLGSMHVDPLGKGFVGASRSARKRHILQVAAWADYVAHWFRWAETNLAFVGGDVNERLKDEHLVAARKPKLAHLTMLEQFRAIGMKAASVASGQVHHTSMLDIWAGGRGAMLKQRQEYVVPVHVKGAEFFDHSLVYARYRVRELND